YGPFSSEVKGLIGRLQNHGLIEEHRLGSMFNVQVGSTYEDARKAYEKQLRQFEPVIEKTADLFMRLDTNQAELVATVLFAARSLSRQKQPPSERDVLSAIMRWKQKRRPPLKESDVASTIRN